MLTDQRSDNKSGHRRRISTRIWPALVLIVAAVAIGLLALSTPARSIDELLRDAGRAMRQHDFKTALELAEEALQLDDQQLDARMFAADAAAQLGLAERSLEHCLLIPDTDKKYGIDARILTATLLQHQHKDRQAEEHLRRALQIDSTSLVAHKLLASSYSRHGRRWESIPHLLTLLKSNSFDIQDLRLLASPDSVKVVADEELKQLAASDDPYNMLAAACSLMALEEDLDRAEELLKRAIELDEDSLETRLRYGRLLIDRGDLASMAAWNDSLPKIAEEFPDTWLIRADWHTQIGELPSAAFCFQQALKTHPNHVAGNYQLGQTLNRLGETEDAETFLARTEHLRNLIKLSSILVSQYPNPDQTLLLEISDTLELVGRPLEAVCWLKFAAQDESTFARHQRLYEQLGGRVSDQTPWTLPSFVAAERLQLDVDDWQPNAVAGRSPAPENKISNLLATEISFRDSTEPLGINHRYRFGVANDQPSGLIYEVTGGGVAALDFDMDDWPDLYLSQAGTMPPFQVQHDHLDQLYRNYRSEHFNEVAELAGIRDKLFGQGVAAGDINNDGFPDLYVANFDGNRIYLNNGDGTFSDQTISAKVSHSYWTTSCAIADITGDSIPDLYDVTYVHGDNVFTQICPENGEAGTCSPLTFNSTPDLLWQGLGDGSFVDASEPKGIAVPNGDGLALVIGAFSDDRQSRIFIANDGRANFYFKPADAHNANQSKPARYAEEALMRGAAFDIEGRPQACMGIASSDFNGDLRQDFLVTNFIAESNTLYLQSDDEHYLDQSRAWDIYESSLQTLGFGSQALDADLDGWPDIMIANGHINSHPIDAPQQRMVPQFYRNIVGTKFRQLTGESVGPYFEKPAIGRSMAVVDWNRDGRPEVAISQLRDNSSLLENTTENSGAWLTLKLYGKDCSRDAVGCRVIVSTPLRKHLSLVTAGDGYQCSNQKQLFFGLGQAKSIDNLTVFWPSGLTQTFTNLRPNTRLSIREGDQHAFICP